MSVNLKVCLMVIYLNGSIMLLFMDVDVFAVTLFYISYFSWLLSLP